MIQPHDIFGALISGTALAVLYWNVARDRGRAVQMLSINVQLAGLMFFIATGVLTLPSEDVHTHSWYSWLLMWTIFAQFAALLVWIYKKVQGGK